jgi:hypothetical protein
MSFYLYSAADPFQSTWWKYSGSRSLRALITVQTEFRVTAASGLLTINENTKEFRNSEGRESIAYNLAKNKVTLHFTIIN